MLEQGEGLAAAAARMPAGDRRYTALVPTQLVRFLDAEPDALRGFDAVLVGGAATDPALLARARAEGVRVVTTYGMTETAGGCVYDGAPLDGVRVRVTDGGVELAGPVLASGYRLDPDATAAAFEGGWFRTRDAGELDAEGRLTVLGRLDDVLISGGVNVAPAAVEAVLREHARHRRRRRRGPAGPGVGAARRRRRRPPRRRRPTWPSCAAGSATGWGHRPPPGSCTCSPPSRRCTPASPTAARSPP